MSLMGGLQRVIFRAFPDCNITGDFWIPPNLRLEKKVGSTGLKICLTDDLIQNSNRHRQVEQRAILAHRNTVLFITHCGINSIVEAVYHR